MIQTFVPGVNGREVKNKLFIYRQLGKYAKNIHSIRTYGFGEKLSNKPGVFKASWEKYIDYNLRSLKKDDPLFKFKVLTEIPSSQDKKILK